MGERAILTVLENFEIPDDSREKDDGRFYEEVALLLHPRLIEVEHYRIGTFVGIRNILHKVRVNGITTVRASRVVEVYHIELRLHLVALRVVQQMIVGYSGQVAEFEIVHIHRKALFYLLLDEIIYHCIGFSAARRTQHDGSPKGIHDIYPAVVPTLLVVEPCRQIDRILAFDKPRFLHETLVFVIEHIVHEVVLQQTAHPQTAHQQADITCANGQDIQSRHRLYR